MIIKRWRRRVAVAQNIPWSNILIFSILKAVRSLLRTSSLPQWRHGQRKVWVKQTVYEFKLQNCKTRPAVEIHERIIKCLFTPVRSLLPIARCKSIEQAAFVQQRVCTAAALTSHQKRAKIAVRTSSWMSVLSCVRAQPVPVLSDYEIIAIYHAIYHETTRRIREIRIKAQFSQSFVESLFSNVECCTILLTCKCILTVF